MKLAVIQFSMRERSSAHDFWQEIEEILSNAQRNGAELIVFPEYTSLPLIARWGADHAPQVPSFAEQLKAWAHSCSQDYLEQWQNLARFFGGVTVCGSYPVATPSGIVNRCSTVFGSGSAIHQDKIHLTRFESEAWKMVGGERKIAVWEFGGLRFATTICFDVEFPELSAALASQLSDAHTPPDVLLVPSCTDSWHGYWRVRHCAAARAVELQAYCVVATCVEGQPAIADLDLHVGNSCVLSPCDKGLPAEGELSAMRNLSPGSLVVELDPQTIRNLRENGTVLNLQWRSPLPVRIETLRACAP